MGNFKSPGQELSYVDGLNPSDPGWQALNRHMDELAPSSRLFAYCGIEGHCQGTRLILDVREQSPKDSLAPAASFEALREAGHRFAGAALWPRAHLGKDFTQLSLAQAGLLLAEGGRVWMAARKSKGAKSLAEQMGQIFGQAPQIVARSSGYAVYCVQRDAQFCETKAQQILDQRYLIQDPRLPGEGLCSAPGVFSRRALDKGTAALIDAVFEDPELANKPPRSVIDLCCGVGPLACVAAKRWGEAQVFGVDSNRRAVGLAQENLRRLGLQDRVEIAWGDGLGTAADHGAIARAVAGRVRLALVNPPTHAPAGELERLFAPLRTWMGPGGKVMLVVSRPGSVTRALLAHSARVQSYPRDGYHVLVAGF